LRYNGKKFLELTVGAICVYGLRMGMPRKPKGQKAVRVNITLPPHLFQAGQDLMRSDFYGSFADMVQGLIRERVKHRSQTAAIQ
jgi:hypothetical protein